MKRRSCLLLTLPWTLLWAVGCAGPSAGWSKPGVTRAEVARDSDGCLGEASYTETVILHRGEKLRETRVDYDRYAQCMRARGYRRPE